MTTLKRTLRSRLVAAAGVLALGLAGLGIVGPAAATPGNIPDFDDGVINVHKYSNPGGVLQTGDGTQATVPAGAQPLAGVTFTLYRVTDIDLVTDNAGWDVLQKISGPSSPVEPVLDDAANPTTVTIDGVAHPLAAGTAQVTNGSGLAAFTGLHPGLYVITEGADTGGNNIVAKAKPFFDVLPIKDGNNWSNTAHVYPKNVVSTGPTKTVDTKNIADGVLTWSVTQAIPTYDATNPLTHFTLKDDLSRAGDTSGTVGSLTLKVNGTALVRDTDYTVALDPTTRVLTITVTDLTKLTSGSTVVAEYTTVGQVGEYANEVKTYINDATNEVGTATAKDYLGKVIVTKMDKDNGNLLKGAVFKVCDNTDGNATKDCVAIGTLTTGDDGIAGLDGLRVPGKYVLVETQAPAGYVLDEQVHPIEFTDTQTTEVELTRRYDITNAKQKVPNLPVTGAAGQVLLVAGGVALILIAGGSAIVARNRRRTRG